MHPEFDWHVTWEQRRPVWLRILDTRVTHGEVVSLAVWPTADGSKWEWEILIASDDQHVHGGTAHSREDAVAAVEAASALISVGAARFGDGGKSRPDGTAIPSDTESTAGIDWWRQPLGREVQKPERE